ncbi:dodecin domain-containing protein [Alkalibacter rhizosphaerae]|uniref:Dodecin domain-containing protein n=1 Tax=Alkalibacter rhizosphaerae TaxID=2815577 RepID=A0A975AH49_9FIRM|nr:dodecin family protein [Alkalibacter rhizosphaerae]QSX08239.1 dodecin domain-containing protein [Alkalibacter rhizosphaerae]
MAVVKVVEIIAQSSEGWEAATQEAITQASKTIKHIESVYVKEFKAIVEAGKIVNYRVNVKISFVVE